MKQFRILLLTFSIILVHFITLTAQSNDWKVIGGIDSVGAYLLYHSADGKMFGWGSDGLMLSENNGTNWQTINTTYDISNQSYIFENKTNDIFLAENRKLYKFDKINKRFVQLISFDAPILDVIALNNGELIVATFENLIKFDNNINKTVLMNWNYSDVKLLSKDNERVDYLVVTSNSDHLLLTLNTDMMQITKDRILPFNVYPSAGSCWLGEKIFIGNKYSDNGGDSWNTVNSLNPLQYSLLVLGKDKKLYYHYQASIWFSEDLGVTFTEIRLPQVVQKLSYINIQTTGDISICYSLCINNPAIYQYNSQTKQWTKNVSIDQYFESYYFAAGENENLVTSNDCGTIYYKENSTSAWSTSNTQAGPSYNMVFRALENGEIISGGEFFQDVIKSSDKGKTWSKINTDFSYSENLIVKKNNIFNIYDNAVNYSGDLGGTWNKISLPFEIGFFGFLPIYDFSDELVMFFVSLNDSGLHSIDLRTLEDKLLIPEVYSAPKTTYDGKTLFVLTLENSDLFLNTSLDRGTTFSKIKIPFGTDTDLGGFFIDYMGNLYLFYKDEIFMSPDNGISWDDISPKGLDVQQIHELNVSFDNYLYISTFNKGILKYNKQIQAPNFKFINAYVYSDTNNNCIKDNGESNLPNVKVILNDNFIQTSDHQGQAKFFTTKNKNVIKTLHNNNYYASCVDSILVIIDSSLTFQSVDIPLKVLKNCVDIKQSISAPRLRRCFDNTYYGHVFNDGTVTSENTKIKVQLDPYFDFISCSKPIISQSSNELTIDLGDLGPGEFKSYHLVIKVNCSAPLGVEHCMTVTSFTDGEKCYSNDTEYIECQDNIGSFDPNDKTIFVNGVRGQEYAIPSDKIEYMIRFQNTGTDTAFTVRIADPLEERFDVTSIRPTVASHDYSWKIENGILEILFEKINLVDSFTNEPLSNGFIKFDIKLNQSTRLGENFSNTAGIFFDFNEPVITNTVISAVGYPSGTKDNRLTYKIIMKPNPTTGQVSFISEDIKLDGFDATILNLQGQAVQSTNIPKGQNQIDINALPPGMYFIQLQNEKVKYKTKIVKI